MTDQITITATAARTIGRLAAKHPTTSVIIAWDEREHEWLVTFDAGYGTLTYVVSTSGKSRPAGLGQTAKK